MKLATLHVTVVVTGRGFPNIKEVNYLQLTDLASLLRKHAMIHCP